MHLEDYTIKVVVLSPDELEDMPEEQKLRLKELGNKIDQYHGMMKTFVQNYAGESMKHRTFEEVLKTKK